MRNKGLKRDGWWFVGGYLLWLGYLLNSGYEVIYGDAGTYWELAYRFFHGHAFSLLAYNDRMRGYAYPLLNVPGAVLAAVLPCAPATAAKVLGAGYAALAFTVVGPRLWQALTGMLKRPSWPQTVVFGVLGFGFWRDYFNFPLSDFPALLALAAGLLALYRLPGWRGHLLAGVGLALAVNIRPIYLASVPFFMVLVLVLPTPLKAGHWRYRGLGLVLGLGLTLLPQALINYRHFRTPTPFVLAESPKYGTRNLYLEKLIWGLHHQKYETAVEANGAVGQLLFLDPAGLALIEREHLSLHSTYRAYARALLHHPADFAGLYARRLFNGLDVQYPTPYVRKAAASTIGLALINYTIWFLVLLYVTTGACGVVRRDQWVVLAVWLAPVVAVLPMSMECRFVLPLHLLAYALLAFGWPAAWRLSLLSFNTRLRLGIAYLGFVLLCLALSSATQANLESAPRLLT
ncbi:hypothetical protein GCM10022408_04590 [Hymenobacter fastidiosus]|uniref:Glycosyltransferase RgtA/B/C/D-like domain-containing protein n=1 Tax=Hymenobacter fastidiosus TaxID=486264 RepID=A0ABP7RG76_9BACT